MVEEKEIPAAAEEEAVAGTTEVVEESSKEVGETATTIVKADEISGTEVCFEEMDVLVKKNLDDQDRIEVGETHDLEPEEDFDTGPKKRGWREPELSIIKKVGGKKNPLRGKKILMLETPQLLEWQMLEKLGAEEQNATIVERKKKDAKRMQELLPKAKVIPKDIREWVVEQAYEKLAGQEAKMEKMGIPLDGSAKANSFIMGSRYAKFRISPKLFDWVWRDPNYKKYASCLSDYLQEPYFFYPQQASFNIDPDKSFDLISLDTKSKYHTFDDTIKLMILMGFLPDKGILATNFVGHRESDLKKRNYESAFIRNQFEDGRYIDWLSKLQGELNEKREESISLDLVDHFCSTCLFNEWSIKNPNNPIFNTLAFKAIHRALKASQISPYCADDLLWGEAMRNWATIEATINKWGFSKEQIRAYLITYFGNNIFGMLIEREWTLRCRRLFRPVFESLPHNQKKKVQKWSERKEYRKITKVSDFWGTRLTYATTAVLGGQMMPVRHKAFGYIGGKRTPMKSDFIHMRQVGAAFSFSADEINQIGESLFLDKPVQIENPKKLVAAIEQDRKLQNHIIQMKKNIKRTQV